MYILFENASGYCLFEKEDFDELGGQLKAIQKAIPNLERFAKMVKLAAFQPFTTAEEALENVKAISQNKVPASLKAFLTSNLPATKSAKKQKFLLGISDPKLGQEYAFPLFNQAIGSSPRLESLLLSTSQSKSS